MTTPVKAAGCIIRAPSGRILMMRRTDGEGWAFAGGTMKDGETAEQAAWRETFEETNYRLGDVGKFLMRRNKDGVDFTTFVADVEAEFVPKLNHEDSAYGWFEPNAVLEEAE
jgi:8-oxo-dGTP pyrophosphatase MutT (NUDIX family)